MAEYVLKYLVNGQNRADEFLIVSSATSTEEIGNHIHYGTRNKLHQVGIPTDDRCAVQLKKSDYEKYDYIIGMDSYNIRNILRILGEDPQHKVCRLLDFTAAPRDIADPWYTGNFDATWRDVEQGCRGLLAYLTGGD